MAFRRSGFRRGQTVLLLAAVAVAAAGCTRIRDHHGYLADTQLVASVQPGVDNRDSVAKTLGRPSFESEFDKGSWYYVSRDTRQLGFTRPKAVEQMILVVHFDQGGTVTSVEKRGLEKAVSVAMNGDKTPTLGRKRTLLGDIFGNIGTVGGVGGVGAGGAPSADNP